MLIKSQRQKIHDAELDIAIYRNGLMGNMILQISHRVKSLFDELPLI